MGDSPHTLRIPIDVIDICVRSDEVDQRIKRLIASHEEKHQVKLDKVERYDNPWEPRHVTFVCHFRVPTEKIQLIAIPHGSDIPEPDPIHSPDKISIQRLVMADIEKREKMGIDKYGGPLQPFDGRDTDWDLYQELLDACCYQRKKLFERDGK